MKQAMRNTLHVSLQLCASLSVLFEPVLPHLMGKLRTMLNLEGVQPSTPGEGTPASQGTIRWADAGGPLLKAGHIIGTPEILVSKVEDEAIEAQRAVLEARAQAVAEQAPVKCLRQRLRPRQTPYEPVKDTVHLRRLHQTRSPRRHGR